MPTDQVGRGDAVRRAANPAAMISSAAPPAAPPATDAAAQANADVPQAVKDACQGDYEKFCSQHVPESDEVRVCMAESFGKLSEPCVTAILDSPLADEDIMDSFAKRGFDIARRTVTK